MLTFMQPQFFFNGSCFYVTIFQWMKEMTRRKKLFTPGPVEPYPLPELELFHHRSVDFKELFSSVEEKLKVIFGTGEQVFLFAASGSGAMEAVIVNLFSPGERVLVVDSGKFGRRWAEMGRVFGLDVTTIVLPRGEVVSQAELEEKLSEIPDISAVLFAAVETATGAYTDPRMMAEVSSRFPGVLLVVDAISSLGAHPMLMDDWGLDVVLGCSQKGLMGLPGLSFIALSSHGWDRVKRGRLPRYYFDLERARSFMQRGSTPFTPASSLIFHLDRALSFILDEVGLSETIKERARFAASFRAALPYLSLSPLAKTSPSNALTAVLPPDGIDPDQLVDELDREFGFVIAKGQEELKGKIFRVGHLGYIFFEDILELIKALSTVLSRMGVAVDKEEALGEANKAYRDFSAG
jgi:aspartate aminotransferase-like enzyme